MSHRSRGRIVFRRHEFHIVEAQTQNVDRFLDQVSVFITGVAKFNCGNANEENAAAGVTVTSRLELGVVRVPIDFLFQRIEDPRPGIWGESCARSGHI